MNLFIWKNDIQHEEIRPVRYPWKIASEEIDIDYEVRGD